VWWFWKVRAQAHNRLRDVRVAADEKTEKQIQTEQRSKKQIHNKWQVNSNKKPKNRAYAMRTTPLESHSRCGTSCQGWIRSFRLAARQLTRTNGWTGARGEAGPGIVAVRTSRSLHASCTSAKR